MSHTHKWFEVRGSEDPGDEPVLLYKFPASDWTPEFRDQLLAQIKAQGVTNVTVAEVDDPPSKGDGL